MMARRDAPPSPAPMPSLKEGEVVSATEWELTGDLRFWRRWGVGPKRLQVEEKRSIFRMDVEGGHRVQWRWRWANPDEKWEWYHRRLEEFSRSIPMPAGVKPPRAACPFCGR